MHSHFDNNADLQEEARPQKSIFTETWWGIAAVVLLFAASAAIAGAYATHIANEQREAQAAAVASADASRPFPSVSLTARAAFVMDITTGRILYEKNASAQLPLASLTKVATVLAVAEVIPADKVIVIPRDSSPTQSAGTLRAGDEWRVRDLISYTLIASSNDGADILADAADPVIRAKYPDARDDRPTLWRMNQLSRELGLTSMYFLNAHGLDIGATQSGGYGSARDVASLFVYAASTSPALFEGTAQGDMLLQPVDGRATEAYNTNKALGAIPGLIMGKTGFTDLAGGNLAIVYDAGLMHPVVAVVLGSTEQGRFSDMKQLVSATQAYLSGAAAGPRQ